MLGLGMAPCAPVRRSGAIVAATAPTGFGVLVRLQPSLAAGVTWCARHRPASPTSPATPAAASVSGGSSEGSTSSSSGPVTDAGSSAAAAAGASGPSTRRAGGGGAKGRGGGGSGSGPRARGSAPTAVAAAAQAAADALFSDSGPGSLAPRTGPVEVAELGGGRGRGLVTTRTVLPGELLLAVAPLALAWDDDCNGGTTADLDSGDLDLSDAKFLEVQRQLLGRRYTAREAAWLASLDGLPPLPEEGAEEGKEEEKESKGAAAGGGPSDRRPPPPDLEAATSAAAAEASAALPERLRDPDTLADMVQANALEPDGGAEDEYAFWARREAAAEAEAGDEDGPVGPRLGPVGVWPQACLLNHSCLPNTVAYVVGSTLFVRASRKMGGGSELTVSYLPVGGGADSATTTTTTRGGGGGSGGSDAGGASPSSSAVADGAGGGGGGGGSGEVGVTLLSPVGDRRAALEDGRGFWCRCSRCVAEEALDPKLRALMLDITESTAALREDLENALAMADAAGDEDEEEEGEEVAATSPSSARQQQQRQGRGGSKGRAEEEEEDEGEDEEGEEGGSRWRSAVASVISRAGLYLELMDAAMSKLQLSPAEQEAAQAAVVPLYTVLWAALGSRGEIEPRLSEVVTALVGWVAPGSADHLWWAATARDTAEILATEEEAMTAATSSRRGGGGSTGGGGFKRQDDRVTVADKTCFGAFKTRYGPISKGVYRGLLASRRGRQEQEDAWGQQSE